jgi:hypothetical protein
MASLASASVDVQYGVSFRPGIGGIAGLRAGGDQAAVERQFALAAIAKFHGRDGGCP